MKSGFWIIGVKAKLEGKPMPGLKKKGIYRILAYCTAALFLAKIKKPQYKYNNFYRETKTQSLAHLVREYNVVC